MRWQLEGSGVTVVELAPTGTETPLFRGEFEREMRGEKAMEPKGARAAGVYPASRRARSKSGPVWPTC
jgi:hypothetical protein